MTGDNSVVWKYPLDLAVEQTIEVPLGARCLCVQLQDERPCLWVAVDPKADKTPRLILLAGTGNPDERLADAGYLGTVQIRGFVWHYFEAAPTAVDPA